MDCKNMPTSTKYKYIYGCKRFLIGKYIIQIMTGMKGNNEGISPRGTKFCPTQSASVAQIYSEHFCFCYTTKQTKRIGTAITKSEFESQIYVYNVCLSRSGVED